jgi:hypothetical protein
MSGRVGFGSGRVNNWHLYLTKGEIKLVREKRICVLNGLDAPEKKLNGRDANDSTSSSGEKRGMGPRQYLGAGPFDRFLLLYSVQS